MKHGRPRHGAVVDIVLAATGYSLDRIETSDPNIFIARKTFVSDW
jgi:hypothetical protein